MTRHDTRRHPPGRDLEPAPASSLAYPTRAARTREVKRDRDQANQAASRSDFLAEASRLLASSLDYETTLSTVAGMALPELGAWCIVDVVEPDGSMRRLSVVHPDPEKQALTSRLIQSWPPERDDPIGAPVVMRTRRSEVIPRAIPMRDCRTSGIRTACGRSC
jgi:K+-sensing histidine kinase KdpD